MAALVVVLIAVSVPAIVNIALWRRGANESNRVARLSVTMPDGIHVFRSQLIGGHTLLVRGAARRPDGTDEPLVRLYTRRLDEYEFTPVEGTEGVQSYSVSVSPRGDWIAFVAAASPQSPQLQIKKVRVSDGGPPLAVAEWKESWTALTWLNDDQLIVFEDGGTRFHHQPINGAPAGPAITIDTGSSPGFGFPSNINPVVGEHGMFFDLQTHTARGYQADQWVLDTRTGKASRLLENAGHAVYAPSGHVVFARGESLMAAPFNADTLAVTGEIAALANGLRVTEEGDHGTFQISSDGSLLYPPGGRLGADRQLIVADTKGVTTPFVAERRPFAGSETPQISANGRTAAVVVTSPRATYEIWVADVDRPGLRRVVAVPDADVIAPALSADGRRVAYSRTGFDNENDGIYVARVDGTRSAQLVAKVTSPEQLLLPVSWMSDGSGLIVLTTASGRRTADIAFVDVRPDGAIGTLKEVVDPSFNASKARISPDGRLLAFDSDERGTLELYVARIGASGALVGKTVVASDIDQGFIHGAGLAWSDSRHLFYRALPNKIMSVTIQIDPTLSVSAPVMVFDLDKLRVNSYSWDIRPDGRLLAVQRGSREDEVREYKIVLNWLSELREHMAKK